MKRKDLLPRPRTLGGIIVVNGYKPAKGPPICLWCLMDEGRIEIMEPCWRMADGYLPIPSATLRRWKYDHEHAREWAEWEIEHSDWPRVLTGCVPMEARA